jgi:hypothetical protein
MTAQFAKGCSLDKGLHRYTPFHMAVARGLVRGTAPANLDDTQHAPRVFDQGPTSSCEGHSSSGCTAMVFKKQGEALPWIPSMANWYRLALCLDRGDPNAGVLRDVGTQTNSIIAASAEFGISGMGALASDGRFSDADPATLLHEPNLIELERDALTLVIGAYQITSTGTQRIADVKAAQANGFGVRIDSFVDTAFEQWTKGSAPFGMPNYADNNGGGHALYCVGYSGDNFVIRNSWSESWGDGGNIIVSPAFVEQADCFAWKVSVAA